MAQGGVLDPDLVAKGVPSPPELAEWSECSDSAGLDRLLLFAFPPTATMGVRLRSGVVERLAEDEEGSEGGLNCGGVGMGVTVTEWLVGASVELWLTWHEFVAVLWVRGVTVTLFSTVEARVIDSMVTDCCLGAAVTTTKFWLLMAVTPVSWLKGVTTAGLTASEATVTGATTAGMTEAGLTEMGATFIAVAFAGAT